MTSSFSVIPRIVSNSPHLHSSRIHFMISAIISRGTRLKSVYYVRHQFVQPHPTIRFQSTKAKKATSTIPPSDTPSVPVTSIYGRFKHMMRQYGKPAFYTYMAVSTIDLSLLFVAVYMGLDVEKLLNQGKNYLHDWGILKQKKEVIKTIEIEKGSTGKGSPNSTEIEATYTITEPSSQSPQSSSDKQKKPIVSTFLIAYALHKLLLPIRIPITMALTPTVVRWLRQWGWMKDVTTISGMVELAGVTKGVVKQAGKIGNKLS